MGETIRNKMGQDGVELEYIPSLVDGSRLFSKVAQEVSWTQHTLLSYGRQVKVPRLLAYQSDGDKPYRYSRICHHPTPLTATVKRIQKAVQAVYGDFDAVLLNYYRNGSDSVSWHCDDEPDLAAGEPIVTVSLGGPRLFKVKHKTTHAVYNVDMGTGSCLAMLGATNAVAQHCVPKTKRTVRPRISLTFRRMA